jgi:methyl-accepting chemotaxis protein
MDSIRPNKRKILNFAVNRKMQIYMVGRIALILLVSLLVSSLAYYFFADREITSSFSLFHITARNFLDFLLPVIIGSFCVSLMIGTTASLFFPKKIAGGLYGIERDVQQIANGDLTATITLRHGDKVGSLARDINLLVDGFRRRIITIQKGLGRAEDVFSAHGLLTPRERLEELEDIYDRMQKEIQNLKVTESS